MKNRLPNNNNKNQKKIFLELIKDRHNRILNVLAASEGEITNKLKQSKKSKIESFYLNTIYPSKIISKSIANYVKSGAMWPCIDENGNICFDIKLDTIYIDNATEDFLEQVGIKEDEKYYTLVFIDEHDNEKYKLVCVTSDNDTLIAVYNMFINKINKFAFLPVNMSDGTMEDDLLDQLEEMIDQGLIECDIDYNGNIVYKLTEEGEKFIKDIEEEEDVLKDIFGDFVDDDDDE